MNAPDRSALAADMLALGANAHISNRDMGHPAILLDTR